jgi:hypothetical protein
MSDRTADVWLIELMMDASLHLLSLTQMSETYNIELSYKAH